MQRPSIVPRRLRIIAGFALVILLLIAAAINVPWALTFMKSRGTVNRVPVADLQDDEIPKTWPSMTPHSQQWPAPEHWSEGGVFGCRIFDVRTASNEKGRNGFSMEVQQLGWPLPVIEQKQMWWDWNDPQLKGPESDPALSLKLQGLVLNPIILGGGAWAVLVLPWILAIALTRQRRRRKARCMDCGYPVGKSDVCTECGSALFIKLREAASGQDLTPPDPSSTA